MVVGSIPTRAAIHCRMDDWASRRESESWRGWFDPNSGIQSLGSRRRWQSHLILTQEISRVQFLPPQFCSDSTGQLNYAPVAQLEEGHHLKHGLVWVQIPPGASTGCGAAW